MTLPEHWANFSTELSHAMMHARGEMLERYAGKGQLAPDVDMTSYLSTVTGVEVGVIHDMQLNEAIRHPSKVAKVTKALAGIVANESVRSRLLSAADKVVPMVAS